MIALEITEGPSEIISDEEGWKHRASTVKLTNSESGYSMVVPFRQGIANTEPPSAEDVLYCILSDAAGYENADDIDDYAAEYGIETPSAAVKLYRQVEAQSKELRRLLGADYHGSIFPTGEDDHETTAARLAGKPQS